MTAEVFLPVAAHLWRGLMATLWVSLLSTLLASAAGIALGVLAQSRQRWLAWPVRWYVEVFRGVPSLLTLLFVFFALPQAGLATSPVAASVIGLGLWGSAGVSEIARGALASIPAQQSEGARALGMGALEATVHVVLPQAARRFLPAYVGQLTVLIQASTITSVVGVTDLLGSARQMIERLAYVGGESHAVAIYAAVLLVFFAICYPLSVLATALMRRLRT